MQFLLQYILLYLHTNWHFKIILLFYVENDEVIKTLHIMDSLVSVGGYIYLDTRNWDMFYFLE